jgi:hypothetical protein
MNITDIDGKWRITDGYIENLKTGELKRLKHSPKAEDLAFMPYGKYMRKCSIAFLTGDWPKTYWSSGRVTD